MKLGNFVTQELSTAENTQPKKVKKPTRKLLSHQTFRVSNLVKYWLFYFAIILYWETIMSLVSHQGFDFSSWFMPFALSQSLFLAILNGWGKNNRLNKIIVLLWTLLLTVFYIAELIYYQSFHSMISFSMIGMGADAIENFGWAMKVTVKKSIGWILAVLVPLIFVFIWQFIKKLKSASYPIWHKPIALLLAVFLWFSAASIIGISATSNNIAQKAYMNSYTDADTAAEQLGVLTAAMLDVKGLVLSTNREDELSNIINSRSQDTVEFDTDKTGTAQKAPSGNKEDNNEIVPVVYKENIIEEIDFKKLEEKATDETTKSLCKYFASVSGTLQNEYTGMFEGYNVIYICAESFSTMAISEEVTPTLYKLSHEGIILNNYYNSFKNTTTNGEFAFTTGLWADVSRSASNGKTNGSFYQSSANYMPYGLGNIFNDMGVKSYAFHNYLGTYYGRNETHPNLGYACKFMGDMEFSNKWPSSDYEMMLQSVDDYINEDRFNVYYMTFSGHGPYNTEKNQITAQNYNSVPYSIGGKTLTEGARCYLSNHIELDKALEYLLTRLEEAGKLDNTLIVMASDHFPYYLEVEDAELLLGYEIDPDFEYYHSTCIMWANNMNEPIVVDAPCCNVDILPTVLNLLGAKYDSRLLPGKDVFSNATHIAVLYNRSFIVDQAKYDATTGNVIWSMSRNERYQEKLQNYIANISELVTTRYAVSLSINDVDFYRFVWENSGLLK